MTYIRLDAEALDALPPREAYQAATQIHHQAKRLGAAYADRLAADLATAHGQRAAADMLAIAQSTLAGRVTRHKEHTMWDLPTTLTIVTADTTGHATPPTDLWWIKTVDPEPAKPTLVYVMRGDDEWLMYRCAAVWSRSDEDEVAAGVQAVTAVARALAEQVPALTKAGKATDLGDGLIDHDKRDQAAAQAWKQIRPTLETHPTAAVRDDIIEWANNVMNGFPSGPRRVL